jgi:hypothetical protein
MAGSRVYCVRADNVTVATGAPLTLAFINPSSTIGIEILRCTVSQRANTTSAQQGIQLHTQVTAFPTLTTNTPAKMNLSDPASGIVGGTAGAAGTAGTNASAEGAGTKTVLFNDNFNVLNGWLWIPTPAETITLNAGAAAGFGMAFSVQPSTLTGWSWSVVYRELG